MSRDELPLSSNIDHDRIIALDMARQDCTGYGQLLHTTSDTILRRAEAYLTWLKGE
jgi:hypothetical protein